jgi:uncharacterized protein YpiB (UPF0302 family)
MHEKCMVLLHLTFINFVDIWAQTLILATLAKSKFCQSFFLRSQTLSDIQRTKYQPTPFNFYKNLFVLIDFHTAYQQKYKIIACLGENRVQSSGLAQRLNSVKAAKRKVVFYCRICEFNPFPCRCRQ